MNWGRAAGVDVDQVRVNPNTGEITVTSGKPDVPGNDLDDWLKAKDAHQAVTKRLADGTRKVYRYAWKGGFLTETAWLRRLGQ